MLIVLAASRAMGVEEIGGIPVPLPRPERAVPDTGAGAAEKGGATDSDVATPAGMDPEDVVAPAPRPEDRSEEQAHKDNGKAAGAAKPTDETAEQAVGKPSLMPPPRPAKMPAEETACRARLNELGVTFEELPQLADESGCSVPWPISVTSLSRTVELAPAAQLNCATALAAAEFVTGTVAPKAKEVFGAELAAIRQDSAYVCRPRNGTAKLSEHAFGNALDIGAFTLSDERQIAVGKAASPEEAAFMLAVRLAACGPFKTVLGPGSDADHATHFHFDLAKRRSGSTFCQ